MRTEGRSATKQMPEIEGRFLALPLDVAIAQLEAGGRKVRVIPYVPPRAGAAVISDPISWRVAQVRAGPGGHVDVVAVAAGEAALGLGERV